MSELTNDKCTVANIVLSLELGGLEAMVVDLVNELDTGEFRPIVICLTEPGVLSTRIHDHTSRIFSLRKKPGLDWYLPWRIMKLLRREKVDIVHAHNFASLLYGSVAARMCGVRGTVYTAHGTRSSYRMDYPFFRRLPLVDRVVPVSAEAERIIIDHARISPDKVTLISNGIDTAKFDCRHMREQKRAELGIAPHAHVIGNVGRLVADKDQSTLIKAFERVVAKHPDARLVIVGDGVLHADLVAQAEQSGLADAVMILGMRDDVHEILSAMDVFVLSSVTEGLPLTLLEATAAGLPCVVTAVGGNPEVIRNGETGLVVAPRNPEGLADAVMHILADRDVALSFGSAAQAQARSKYDLRVMVRRYEDVYREIMMERGAEAIGATSHAAS